MKMMTGDGGRERERAKAKIKASARNTTYKSLIGTLIKLELGGK